MHFLNLTAVFVVIAGQMSHGQTTPALPPSPSFSSHYTALKDRLHYDDNLMVSIWTSKGLKRIAIICRSDKSVLPVGGSQQIAEGQVIEWRLANGTPIAVIVPVTFWEKKVGLKEKAGAQLSGNLLSIQGVVYHNVYSMLDTAIDATAPGAQDLARRLADNSIQYWHGKK